LANGLSTAITKDGQTTVTANIPLAGFKVTGLGAATVGTDAAQYAQLQGGTDKLITVTGTDTLTGSLIPVLTAYAAGNQFSFVAANTNTGAVTINIDGVGVKSITKNGATALVAGDIVSGSIVVIEYDGTRFQMVNAANTSKLVAKTSSTGSAVLPTGTTGERDSPASAGYIRYNTTTATFEGYSTAWGSIGGGATGAGGDTVFQENSLIVNNSYTLTTAKNAMSVGPITIVSGKTVTIPSGQRWLIF